MKESNDLKLKNNDLIRQLDIKNEEINQLTKVNKGYKTKLKLSQNKIDKIDYECSNLNKVHISD